MDTFVLVTVAFCFLTIFLLKKLYSRGSLPPGPLGLPVLGYTLFLSKKPHLDFQRLAKKYGNVFSLKMGSKCVVILNDFESTKEAFSKDEFVGRPPEFPLDFNEETIKTEAILGVPWKEQRRFSLHILKDLGLGKSKMEVHIQEEIRDLLEHLEQNVGKPFCVYELLASSMSNNIGSLVFGKRLKYDDPIRQMMNRVLKETGSAAGQAAWTLFFPWARKILKFLNILDIDKSFRIQKELRDYIRKEIIEHEETLDSSKIRDYIDGYLLEIEKRKDSAFCKPVLQDMVNAFFVAGSETVRLSVEWLLLTVAVHQDAQLRIQHEIDEIIGRNQLPVWTHHKSMPFTEAVIMELNRWRTIIPLNILRYAVADGKVSGYVIPRQTYLLSNLWAIHHDPEY